MSENKPPKKNNAIRLVSLIAILAIVAVIWILKNPTDTTKNAAAPTNTVTSQATNLPEPTEEAKSSSTATPTASPTEMPAATATKFDTATATPAVTNTPTVTSSATFVPAAAADASIVIDNTLSVTKVEMDIWKSYGIPILIDFGADSCIPCKQMAPVLKKMNEEWNGKVLVKFVDVWKHGDAAANLPLTVIPTQFIFGADGKPYVPSKTIGIEFSQYQLEETGEHVYTTHQGGLTEEQIRAIMKELGVE